MGRYESSGDHISKAPARMMKEFRSEYAAEIERDQYVRVTVDGDMVSLYEKYYKRETGNNLPGEGKGEVGSIRHGFYQTWRTHGLWKLSTIDGSGVTKGSRKGEYLIWAEDYTILEVVGDDEYMPSPTPGVTGERRCAEDYTKDRNQDIYNKKARPILAEACQCVCFSLWTRPDTFLARYGRPREGEKAWRRSLAWKSYIHVLSVQYCMETS